MVGFIEELQRNGRRGINWEFIARPEAISAIKGAAALGNWSEAIRVAPLRVIWEQTVLPLRARSADVLVSAANYGPLLLSRRHVVVSQNALHFCSTSDAPSGVRFGVEKFLARAAVKRAQVTVVASQAMQGEVIARTCVAPRVIPFGPGLVKRPSARETEPFLFLHPTSYGPHKNFTAILQAVAEVAADHPGVFVVESACDPTTPFARRFKQSARDRELLADPVIAQHVNFYNTGSDVQRSVNADAVMIASETESFCFPLAEGMAAGLPVVVADAPFAREMCGSGAIFADLKTPGSLAAAMREVLVGGAPPVDVHALSRLSWRKHVDEIAKLCADLGQTRAGGK